MRRLSRKEIPPFNEISPAPSSSEVWALTSEQKQRAAWANARLSANAERRAHLQIKSGGQRMMDLADVIRASECVTVDHSESIWKGIMAVATVLREAGYPKPKD